MAVRIQLRRDTSTNWTTNNPVLYPGEVGLETDTLKFKVGPVVESPAVGTAWNSIAEYANVVPGDFNNTLEGYLEVTDIGAQGGVVGLNNSKNAIVPGSSITFEGVTDNAFETTITVEDPTADHVVTIPNATTTMVGTNISQTLTNKTLTSPVITSPSITGLYLGDGSVVFEGATADSYETTVTVEEPTADRTLTLPDATGTIATESYVDTAISEFDALPTQTGNDGKFLQTTGSTTQWATVDLSTKQDIVTGVSDTEIGYLNGVTSAIQDQLDDKLDSATASTTYQAIVSGVSDTEIGYLNGVTSAIQDQLDDKFNSADASTTNITEGTSLYFTNERAQDAVAAMITDSTHTGISVSYTDNGSSEGDLSFTNTGVTSLTGTANEVTVSSSTGGVTIGLPDNVTIGNNLVVYGDLDVQGTTTTTYSNTVSTHDNLIYLNAAQDSTITNAVGDGTYVTYTADNSYTTGMDIRVTGMNPSSFNISTGDALTVYSATSTQFVVAKTTTDSFVSGGTAHAKLEANADLGFAGGYYDAGYAHAGLFRDASDGKFKIFDGYTLEPDEAVNIDTTHASFALADFVASSIEATSATIGDVSNTELQYLNGVTSAIQTQLDDKSTASKTETFTNKTLTSPKINEDVALTATATELNVLDGITASTAELNILDGVTSTTAELNILDGVTSTAEELNILDGATLSTTELNYVDGVTSAIQTQLNAKAPLDSPTFTTQVRLPSSVEGPNSSTSVNLLFGTGAGNITLGGGQSSGNLTLGGGSGRTTGIIGIGTGATTTGTKTINLGTGSTGGTTAITIGSADGATSNITLNGNITLPSTTSIGDVSSTELSYVNGVTSAIQTQLDGKVDESLFDTKGDILVASADNTPAKLAVGTNGYLLTANSSATNGVEWAAPPITLPSQSGNTGKYLTTDGTDASWASLVVPITAGTATITLNTATTVDTLSTESAAEYTLCIIQGGKIRTSKVIVNADHLIAGSADMTEFAITETGGAISGVLVSVTYGSGAELNVTVTDAATTNATVKFTKVTF